MVTDYAWDHSNDTTCRNPELRWMARDAVVQTGQHLTDLRTLDNLPAEDLRIAQVVLLEALARVSDKLHVRGKQSYSRAKAKANGG